MDRIEIGALVFARSAAAADDRLEAANIFKEKSLDLGGLAFDTLEADVFTKTKHKDLAAVPGGTPVLVYRGERQTARFFTKTIRRTGARSYHVSAISAMSVLTAMPHPGGIYTGQTAAEVIRDICGGVPVAVKSSLAKIALYGWLPYVKPPESSARDNLSQVLFAIGASLGTDLDGVLRVEPLWDGTANTIGTDRMYSGGSVEYGNAVTSVTVMEHQYVRGGESRELFNGTTQEGDIILFDGPMHSLSASGFTIRSSGANHAVVSAGSGTLSGKEYIHTTRQVTEQVTPAGAENVKTVKDATLVSLVNSTAAAKRLAAYYRCRETIKNPVVAGEERPGDVVSIYHPYDKRMVDACIASADITLSSTLKSDLTALVGYKPPQVENIEYYNEREVLTGSGKWTPPEGVDSVRAVLIGGGVQGSPGGNGESGKRWNLIVTDAEAAVGGTFSSPSVAAGKGGAAGVGGMGGKVYQVDISIETSGSFSFRCGDAVPNGGTASETSFGSYSSASGSNSNAGFTDLITGEVYAKKGSAGLKGGDGGAGKSGSGASGGSSGESIGSSPGGKGAYGSSAYSDHMNTYINGPGGGGAAYGGAGKDATTNYRNKFKQGDGASAAQPAAATSYGDGGTGGNGGGGSGGMGSGTISYSAYSLNDGLWATCDAGTGGTGSPGGVGKAGCIILYYRKAKAVKSGPMVTADKRFLLDPHRRRLIV